MLQRIFKIRYLLIAVIALTGGYIFISLDEVINHCDIFTSEDNLTWGGPGTSAHKFCSFPDGTDSNMLFATDYPGGGILFRLWNPYTRSARETHLSGFCMNDVAEKYFGQLWADTLNQCAYFVSTKNGADYYLLKITGNQHQGLFVRSYYLYTHPAYQRLRDSLYIAHGKTFYGYRLINRTSDSIRVVAVRDGYRLEISQNIYDTLRPYFVTEGRPFHAYHRKMAKILSETTGAAFTPLDAMRLFYFYNAYYWWKEFFFNKYPFSTDLGFLSANIFGLIDANGDTHPDILINIYSVRYINQLILCYDIHNEKLLWTREFAPHIHSANITDIDHDGQHEIVFTSYSPCSSPDMDYYDKWPETGLPHYSYFRILNADGSNKIINGKKTEYQYPEINFHTIVYLILPEQCKAILGIHTDYGYSTKYLEIYDFKQNRVYQTSVPYQSIRYLNYEDTTVVFINSEIQPGNMGFLLSRTELNPDLSVKRITAKRSSNAKSLYDFLPSPCRPANPYPMLGEKYYITNFNIFSADLRLLYTSDYRFNKSIWKGDEVFLPR